MEQGRNDMTDVNDYRVLSYTIADAAERVGVKYRCMYRWVKEGRVPAVRIGKKHLVSEAALRDLVANGAAR